MFFHGISETYLIFDIRFVPPKKSSSRKLRSDSPRKDATIKHCNYQPLGNRAILKLPRRNTLPEHHFKGELSSICVICPVSDKDGAVMSRQFKGVFFYTGSRFGVLKIADADAMKTERNRSGIP